jgi:peptidoglycan/LPS O-acetylase OafA/YrhL
MSGILGITAAESGEQSDRERKPIRALTGIRFFAAFHVVWYHYAPRLTGWPDNVGQNGYMAVGLFFILSGFVLSYNYEGRRIDTRRFWLARFARIYPAYLLAFLLMAPAVAVRLLTTNPHRFKASGMAALALLQGWYPSLALAWNGPGWSLSDEAFFYLLFPILLPALRRLSQRSLSAMAGVCALAALLPAVADSRLPGVSFIPLFRLAEFSLGVVAGLLFVRGVRLGGSWLFAASASLAAFAVFSPALVPAAWRPGLAAPLFALFVFALASSHGICSRFLGGKSLHALGEASYSVYILQSPLMALVIAATQGMHTTGPRTPATWLQFCLYGAVLVVSALACYRWVETPSRRWIIARFSAGGKPEKQVGGQTRLPEYAVAS